MSSFFDDALFYTSEMLSGSVPGNAPILRGKLTFAACASGAAYAAQTVRHYRQFIETRNSADEFLSLLNIEKTFQDSETGVRLDEHVGGNDIFLFQNLYNPNLTGTVNQNYMDFLIAARTFKEHGAQYITAVLPYLAYARQDKPTLHMREPVTARLMADLTLSAGVDRIVSWHPHSLQIHGFYGSMPVNFIEPVTGFIHRFRDFTKREDVIVVAPDEGAAKLAIPVANALQVSHAIISKFRSETGHIETVNSIGDFSGKKTALIIDDIMSSGSTLDRAVRHLTERYALREIHAGISHNLCIAQAYSILTDLHNGFSLATITVTNSIPQTRRFLDLPFLSVYDISGLLARVINRIHYNVSVSDIFHHR